MSMKRPQDVEQGSRESRPTGTPIRVEAGRGLVTLQTGQAITFNLPDAGEPAAICSHCREHQGVRPPADQPLHSNLTQFGPPKVAATPDEGARVYQNSGQSVDLAKLLGHLESSPLGEAFGGPPREEQPPLTVVKYGYTLPIATGPDRAPLKTSRYRRARRRLREATATVRLRVGEWIAGVELRDEDDW